MGLEIGKLRQGRGQKPGTSPPPCVPSVLPSFSQVTAGTAVAAQLRTRGLPMSALSVSSWGSSAPGGSGEEEEEQGRGE